ncbi:uncharacterized protein H6S33_001471 [Morchella sextelata]|uniref:uncharacterized protein n=1 Tax=Morchella sextelata TaxID=1174677 RepID=UPI001D03EF06|nr:uncharacterized protein H6S33_001471 [Morchella sextelata]KAH0608337.1 hypothetical protein H6S33_001471 [Morchella sextelata]
MAGDLDDAQNFELIRAVIASFSSLRTTGPEDVLNATVNLENAGVLHCTLLIKPTDLQDNSQHQSKYEAPLLEGNGSYSAVQLIAEFLNLFVTYLWMKESTVTNDDLREDLSPPNSITTAMC